MLVLYHTYLALDSQVPMADAAINNNMPGADIKLLYLIKLLTLNQIHLLLPAQLLLMVEATYQVKTPHSITLPQQLGYFVHNYSFR
jgi:hypothetical protein